MWFYSICESQYAPVELQNEIETKCSLFSGCMWSPATRFSRDFHVWLNEMARYGFKGASKSRRIVRTTIFSAITAAYGRLGSGLCRVVTWGSHASSTGVYARKRYTRKLEGDVDDDGAKYILRNFRDDVAAHHIRHSSLVASFWHHSLNWQAPLGLHQPKRQ